MSSINASKDSTSSASEEPLDAPTLGLFRAEYRKADLFCQEVQSFLNLAGVPALNELRNAGKHLIDSLDDDGSIARPEDLRLGIAHCRRACYEAYEAGILSALEVVQKFREDYSTVPVEGVLTDYPGVLKKAHAAQKSVEIGRHPEFDRAQDHTVRMDAFRDLRECAENLMVAREEMNKKAKILTSTATNNARLLVLALLTLAAAILIGVWQKYDLWVPWDSPTATKLPPAANNPPKCAIDVKRVPHGQPMPPGCR